MRWTVRWSAQRAQLAKLPRFEGGYQPGKSRLGTEGAARHGELRHVAIWRVLVWQGKGVSKERGHHLAPSDALITARS
jgi:hypothetical protein